jgi:hypothetical protein
MAYMSQENKKSKQEPIKDILKKYGLKGSLSVRHYSTLVLNIKSGKIDFITNYNSTNPGLLADTYIDVNTYHFNKHFTGIARRCLYELIETMNIGNHDNSDAMTDYFDVGWYIDINIGKWDKPYILSI